ncbi:MAG: hypothetical protein U9Q03_03090 [Patescibacteria group bacterium]|nr:hypothetical protein [Patescibacteria group bacterium]
MERGLCVVIIGPVASGKTTVIKHLVQSMPGAVMMRTYTTRPPRKGERESGDRLFVSREEFERMIDAGEFVEWDEHFGHLYGSARAVLDGMLDENRAVFTNINVDGAVNYIERVPETVTVFIDVPDEQIAGRIENRERIEPEELALRMKEVARERSFMDRFDHVVENPNGKLNETFDRMREILEAELSAS